MTDEEIREYLSRKTFYVSPSEHGITSIMCETSATHPFFKKQNIAKLFLDWELSMVPYKELSDMMPLFLELEEMIDSHVWKKLAEYRANL
ncbi:MAG: hypothetical protein ACK5PF_06420 [bacterium]|jgi:hypothetical protein